MQIRLSVRIMVVVLTIIMPLLIGAVIALAHETDDWTHMTATSGPIVQTGHCGGDITLWSIDYNGDHAIDVCKHVIFNHGVVHVKVTDPVDGMCSCELLP